MQACQPNIAPCLCAGWPGPRSGALAAAGGVNGKQPIKAIAKQLRHSTRPQRDGRLRGQNIISQQASTCTHILTLASPNAIWPVDRHSVVVRSVSGSLLRSLRSFSFSTGWQVCETIEWMQGQNSDTHRSCSTGRQMVVVVVVGRSGPARAAASKPAAAGLAAAFVLAGHHSWCAEVLPAGWQHASATTGKHRHAMASKQQGQKCLAHLHEEGDEQRLPDELLDAVIVPRPQRAQPVCSK